MNNRHRRIAWLKAQENARILEWGALQAIKKEYPNVEAKTFAEAIKIVPAEELVVNNDWWEDE